MKIDWFTVIAQIINFFILVWLLKRFLYKPILNAIEKRENKIKSKLEEAETKKVEAKREQEEFKQKNDAFDEMKNTLMDKMIEETQTEGEKLLIEVRNVASALELKLKKAAKEKQKNISREISQKTQQEVFAISRKVLANLASASLEEQMVAVFINRLNELNETEVKQFIASFSSNSNLILIKSAFELPNKQKFEITKVLDKIFKVNVKYEFNVNPEAISGIELTTKGYKLAWSISEYINALEKSISETIKENPVIETK